MAGSPFELLKQIDALAKSKDIGLPEEREAKEEWLGIAFSVQGQPLVAAMGQVVEVLQVPPMTKVPGAKSWVMGMANVRGNLLPIMDLSGFITGKNVDFARDLRVLALNLDGVYTGVMVEAVTGLKHFELANRTKGGLKVRQDVERYVDEGFVDEGELWPVFNMRKLIKNQDFIDAAQ